MSNDKISLIRLNKRKWFGKDRKTKFRFAEPTHNYFMSKIKEVTEDFLTENKDYLLEHNPALLYTMRNKPVPKKYQGKVAADIKFLKPVEPYKQKGITSEGQFILKKEGKKK